MLLQLRDDKPDISLPLTWSVFAGAVLEGEDDETALRREMLEELGISASFTRIGATPANTWYVVDLTDTEVAAIRRNEGCGHGFFSFAGLKSLFGIEGKGGLGGAIRKFMERAPQKIQTFLVEFYGPDGMPDLAILTGAPIQP